jgi:hypothetical protein
MHTADASALTPPRHPRTGATLIFENGFDTTVSHRPKSAKHQLSKYILKCENLGYEQSKALNVRRSHLVVPYQVTSRNGPAGLACQSPLSRGMARLAPRGGEPLPLLLACGSDLIGT